jgi:hypothetical protein
MVIADLIQLAAQYEGVICEGDIDIDDIIQIVTHAVTISNHGSSYDFFDRPEQRHMLEDIRNRSDLSDEEKEERIQNAYRIVGGGENDKKEQIHEIPRETIQYGVKQIIRNDNTTAEQTAKMIAEYFGLVYTR